MPAGAPAIWRSFPAWRQALPGIRPLLAVPLAAEDNSAPLFSPLDIEGQAASIDGQIAAVNAKILSRAGPLAVVAFRLCAAASICLAAGGALLAESATVVSPICAAADLRLMTLIEAHGEAQDVAAETLAQAFFTVVEARKTCNQGQVESAIKLYESIPLGAGTPDSQ